MSSKLWAQLFQENLGTGQLAVKLEETLVRGQCPLVSDTEGSKYVWPPPFFGKLCPLGTQGKYVI